VLRKIRGQGDAGLNKETTSSKIQITNRLRTQEGVKPNPRKIESIKLFPLPKTAKKIKSFLGLVEY